jgi:hypothetical protein
MPHLHYVHVIAIRKIVSAEDDLLERDVRLASHGTGATNRYEPTVGTVPILVRYGASSPKAIRSYSMTSSLAVAIQSVGDLYSPYVLFHEDAVPTVEAR